MPTECEGVAPNNSICAKIDQQKENKEKLTYRQQQDEQETTISESKRNGSDNRINNTMMDLNGSSEDIIMSTSQTSMGSNGSGTPITSPTTPIDGKKTLVTSPDSTAYVAKARVTRPTPPPPSYNPMQFVQIKPCSLYQSAQQQLKKAEEVKKVKEIIKEEPEDWQNNLDSWKSSRRKRVEHIIDRVVEVKKLELEEHDRQRRKSKTFSEMIEERGERGGVRGMTKLASLAVYNEEETNDLSDLGIGHSSASGKSSVSEDYDNNSVMSDNVELEKNTSRRGGNGLPGSDNGDYEDDNARSGTNGLLTTTGKTSNESNTTLSTLASTRDYISSPGYDTCSSTAPASSPDPCEYTYEGAIQDYKQRISRTTTTTSTGTTATTGVASTVNGNGSFAATKPTTPERNGDDNGIGIAANNAIPPPTAAIYPTRRGSKIEDRLSGFEVTSPSDSQEVEKSRVNVPKVDISKRKEIFESQKSTETLPATAFGGSSAVPRVSLRERFVPHENTATGNGAATTGSGEAAAKLEVKRLSGDITSIRDRLQSLEQQSSNAGNGGSIGNTTSTSSTSASSSIVSKLVDMAMPPLKERLSSLHNAASSRDEAVPRKPLVPLVDARQLEIMKGEDERHKQQQQQQQKQKQIQNLVAKLETKPEKIEEKFSVSNSDDLQDKDRDDSGIHTADDIDVEEPQPHDDRQLNAAIAALAVEELQLEAAASAVNQIEAEFAELSTSATMAMPALLSGVSAGNDGGHVSKETIPKQPSAPSSQQRNDMEFSINEALELALDAIDKETTSLQHPERQQTELKNKQLKSTINKNASKMNQNESNQTQSQIQTQIQINKTDEEKNRQQRQRRQQPATNSDAVEHQIAKEPIYENITTAAATNSNDELMNSNSNTIDLSISQATVIEQKHIIPIKRNDNSAEWQQSTISSPYKNSTETIPPPTTTTTTVTTSMELNKVNISSEPYYQVPKKLNEPYYDAPKNVRPVPVYENIDVFYTATDENGNGVGGGSGGNLAFHANSRKMEPPKEKPPPPPIESPKSIPYVGRYNDNDLELESTVDQDMDAWSSSDNTYETISSRQQHRSATNIDGNILLQLDLPKKTNGILNGGSSGIVDHPSPPIKRMNSTKRIKKELRHKRSSFLGIEGAVDDDDEERYLEMTVVPPPDMAQLLQEERRLEKQLYMKAAAAAAVSSSAGGMCDSSDTGESRDSGVSENHSRQSSEHYTNSSEENESQVDSPPPPSVAPKTTVSHLAAPIPTTTTTDLLETRLLTTVKGNCAESWTESATVAAAATKSLTEATATANAKMQSIEEKMREQEEVLRVERELLQLEQEELKRQRENLLLRENMARRELQHGAKMLMSANRHSLQDLHVGGLSLAVAPQQHSHHHHQQQQQQQQLQPMAAMQQQLPHFTQQQQQQQQIYANVPAHMQQQLYHMETDYRKSMSDLNEFSKRLMLAPSSSSSVTTSNGVLQAPKPPTKPLRAGAVLASSAADDCLTVRQRHYGGGSLVKIASTAQPLAAPRGHIYSNYTHAQSAQNIAPVVSSNTNGHMTVTSTSSSTSPSTTVIMPGQMSRNKLHALSATPKPKYTDGWVHVQHRKSHEATNLANDPAWLSAYQQKRKSMPPDATFHSYSNGINSSVGGIHTHWLVQEAEQQRLLEQQQQQRRVLSNGNTPLHHQSTITVAAASTNGKPLPDSIIQTLTERVQSKGIGERHRFENKYDKSPLHAAAYQQQQHHQQQTSQQHHLHYQNHSPVIRSPIKSTSNGGHSSTATAATVQSSTAPQQEKMLSVSGKKKCSHCGDELGRGAAMIIESLLLFYHINCFKCCVCHVQLGDGLNGTDVRVRNNKLHCQNCYSSDDGIKFSCV